MKKYILALVIFLAFQSSFATKYIIQSPFNHYENLYKGDLSNTVWYDWDVENAVQTYLYRGGLFVKSQSGAPVLQNNYLNDHEFLCINTTQLNSNDYVLAGTNNGKICIGSISSNQSVYWETEPRICNGKVNCIYVGDGLYLAGTDAGIFRTTSLGETWEITSLETAVKCICSNNNGIYLACTGDAEVYKSTDDGYNWTLINNIAGTVLFYYNDVFYSGTVAGLQQSTDGGENWSSINDATWTDITAITCFEENSVKYIYVGTASGDCYRANIATMYWHHKVVDNNNNPINSLVVQYNGSDYKLYAATDEGLFKCLTDDNISFDQLYIYLPTEPILQKEFKMLINYTAGNSNEYLFIACEGWSLFPNNIVEYNESAPSNPSNWGNFNCHGFAWHFKEGGLLGIINFNEPSGSLDGGPSYVIKNDNDPPVNWDYIQVIDNTKINNGEWEKVTYGYDMGHSAILEQIETPFEPTRVLSKWTPLGPLVRHYINDCPFETNKRYWKSSKKVSNSQNSNYLITSQFIGRQISTEGTTIIPDKGLVNYSIVEFYVAPMINHFVHLNPGFHARLGSFFHAYVATDANIPWEATASSKEVAISNKDLPKKKTGNKLNLKFHPNPATNEINIVAEINDYKGSCPVNIKIFSLIGNLKKEFILYNGLEANIDISEFHSGNYLILGETSIDNTEGTSVNLSDSEIIQILK
ncbi:MAG: hypothetical protein NT007_08455 [Candidatus Kapabacteria bacterium]|nr:hypothetical protein [Candidatus Kapabacteria bacterium]